MATKTKKTVEPLNIDGKILTLDLSTTSTGCCVFVNRKFEKSWKICPDASDIPGLSKMRYPEAAYRRILVVTEQVAYWVSEEKPDIILIEEINRGISRIPQKSLDALHFFVLDAIVQIDPSYMSRIVYKDSNGKTGWRGELGLKLSEEDKEYNKKARNHNKNNKLQLSIIDWKTLACRYLNGSYGWNLDPKEDADEADAICLCLAFLKANPK